MIGLLARRPSVIQIITSYERWPFVIQIIASYERWPLVIKIITSYEKRHACKKPDETVCCLYMLQKAFGFNSEWITSQESWLSMISFEHNRSVRKSWVLFIGAQREGFKRFDEQLINIVIVGRVAITNAGRLTYDEPKFGQQGLDLTQSNIMEFYCIQR